MPTRLVCLPASAKQFLYPIPIPPEAQKSQHTVHYKRRANAQFSKAQVLEVAIRLFLALSAHEQEIRIIRYLTVPPIDDEAGASENEATS